MQYLVSHYEKWGITSLAIPPLGCGNGQLEWKAVGPLIYQYVEQMNIPTEMYAPYGTPARELTVYFLSQPVLPGNQRHQGKTPSAMNSAWVALVEILSRIEEQPYHWPVGRTIFQKIAYVATQQGLPTGFVHQKSSFGPFSKELKSAVAKLINNNLLQEEKQGNMFRVKVGPNFERTRRDFDAALSRWETIIAKTTDLFMRINTDQAEIVSTVLFAADSLKKTSKDAPTESQVLASVMQWKQKRRPPLDESTVALTIRNLGMLRWLNVQHDASLPVPEDEFART